jgi:hypothetical protein
LSILLRKTGSVIWEYELSWVRNEEIGKKERERIDMGEKCEKCENCEKDEG